VFASLALSWVVKSNYWRLSLTNSEKPSIALNPYNQTKRCWNILSHSREAIASDDGLNDNSVIATIAMLD
jgi:hypothetical protein